VPTVLLPVPHFEQSRDGACLPACVRMVLAYWGQSFTEAEIAKVLGTKAYGTPISNVERFSRQDYQVEFGSFTVDHLKDSLTAARPVISRVWTDMLDYWSYEATSHVVVVVGFDDSWVYLNDPSLIEQAPPVTWASYLAAWAEFDETAVLIYPVR